MAEELKASYFKLFKIMLKTLWDKSPVFIFILIADILISSLSVFPNIVFPRYIIDSLVKGEEVSTILFLSACMVGTSFVFNSIRVYLNNKRDHLSLILGFTLSKEISIKCLDIDYGLYDNIKTLDKRYYAYQVVNDNNFVALLESIKNFFTNIIILVGIIALTLRIDVSILIIATVVIAIQSVITAKSTEKQMEYGKEAYPYMRRSEYIQRLANIITYRKDILVYDAKEYICKKLEGYNSFLFGFFKKLKKFQVISTFIGNFFAHIYQFVMYAFLGIKMLSKAITIGEFSLYLSALNTFVNSCNGAISSVIDIKRRVQYFAAYREFMNIESVFRTGTRSIAEIPGNEYVITFDNVSFSYSDSNIYVLKNVSIEIKPGEKLAIVGDNGAGKTTFTLLLMRFYDPQEGRILLNGVDIREIKYEEYLKIFGTVFQDYKIFGYSVLENITFTENNTNEEIERAKDILKENGLESRVNRMSHGIDTYLTKELDQEGEELSGGESQKLAIARAAYKGAPILIMDEPTASLDPDSEYELYMKFADMTQGKTSLFISHRLACIHFCDRIAVFEGGRIVELGTHEELMGKSGKYSEMYNKQLELYNYESQKPIL